MLLNLRKNKSRITKDRTKDIIINLNKRWSKLMNWEKTEEK